MFKKFSKNPFDKSNSTKVISNEQQDVRSRPVSFPTERPQPQYSKSSQESQMQGEVPPRVFEVRGQPEQQGTSMSQDMKRHDGLEGTEMKQDIADSWNQNLSHMVPPEETPVYQKEQPETTLGEGVVIKGELTFQRLVRIDGHFEGTLVSEGKLIVGRQGVVKADITLKEAIIEGFVEGNMSVERVELRGEAQVHGNITTESLSVDEGVTIIGNVKVAPGHRTTAETPTED